jgi:hypothetical protein
VLAGSISSEQAKKRDARKARRPKLSQTARKRYDRWFPFSLKDGPNERETTAPAGEATPENN